MVTGSGVADDDFVSYEKRGDGHSLVVGCDGEMVVSIDPDKSYDVTVSILYSSPTNKFLQDKYNAFEIDREAGFFPILIKDLRGTTVFQSENAFVALPSARTFGRNAPTMDWTIIACETTVVEG
jgi:hypothetical protein